MDDIKKDIPPFEEQFKHDPPHDHGDGDFVRPEDLGDLPDDYSPEHGPDDYIDDYEDDVKDSEVASKQDDSPTQESKEEDNNKPS